MADNPEKSVDGSEEKAEGNSAKKSMEKPDDNTEEKSAVKPDDNSEEKLQAKPEDKSEENSVEKSDEKSDENEDDDNIDPNSSLVVMHSKAPKRKLLPAYLALPPELFVKLFNGYNLAELAPVRLVCRHWNRSILEHIITYKTTVKIIFGTDDTGKYLKYADYVIFEQQEMKDIIANHSMAEQLALFRIADGKPNFGCLVPSLALLSRLRQLTVSNFHFQSRTIRAFSSLTHLRSLHLSQCCLSGENLDKLSANLEHIHFDCCPNLTKGNVYDCLVSLARRGAPLKDFWLKVKNSPHRQSQWNTRACQEIRLLAFLLENFASLEVLILKYASRREITNLNPWEVSNVLEWDRNQLLRSRGIAPYYPHTWLQSVRESIQLNSMVATKLQVLTLKGVAPVKFQSFSEHFFPAFFQNPLSNFQIFVINSRPLLKPSLLFAQCPILEYAIFNLHQSNSSEFIDSLVRASSLRQLQLYCTREVRFKAEHIFRLVRSCRRLEVLLLDNYCEHPPVELVAELKQIMERDPGRPYLRIFLSFYTPGELGTYPEHNFEILDCLPYVGRQIFIKQIRS